MTVVLLAGKADKMQAIVKPTRWQRIEFMSRLSTKKKSYLYRKKSLLYLQFTCTSQSEKSKNKNKETTAIKR